MTEDQMAGWHHRLDGRESEQTPGGGEAQGSPACCGPWGHTEPGTTEGLSIKANEHTGSPEAAAEHLDVTGRLPPNPSRAAVSSCASAPPHCAHTH